MPSLHAAADRALPAAVPDPSSQDDVVAVGELVRLNSREDDRVAVLYSRANAIYYTGRQSAVPYQWSSMYRAIPEAEDRLVAAMTGPDRAAWVIEWQSLGSFGMDSDGRIGAALESGYRPVADQCGRTVHVRSDRRLRRLVVPTEACRTAGPQPLHVAARPVTESAAGAPAPRRRPTGATSS